MITVGVDTGSRTVKTAVMLDGRILSQSKDDIGISSLKSSVSCTEKALKAAGLTLKDVDYVVSTGYGRTVVPFSKKHVSDIASHTRGAVWFFPTARTILDIGGQDTKAINCDKKSRITNFTMNEKCAGGTGRFMEIMADMLNVPYEDMGNLSLKSQKKLYLTSTCVIFAKSEALEMLLEGKEKTDIIASVHRSIAIQCNKLLGRISLERDLVLTGGGCRNIGVVKQIEEVIGVEALVPPDPQMVGAIGAAAIARDRYLAGAS